MGGLLPLNMTIPPEVVDEIRENWHGVKPLTNREEHMLRDISILLGRINDLERRYR